MSLFRRRATLTAAVSRPDGHRLGAARFVAQLEPLECRRLLSTASARAANVVATPAIKSVVKSTFDNRFPASDRRNATNPQADRAYTQYQYAAPFEDPSTPFIGGPFTPTQIRAAYGMNTISFAGIVGDGAGQTIAIVDAYDNPSFVSSTDPNFSKSDLHRFDVDTSVLGATGRINVDPPSFTKLDQRGGTNYPAYDPGWAGEIALDVEWAHVMAPKANIILIEADSNNGFDLRTAVNYAKSIPGVTAVSMSYGSSEFLGETDSFVDQTYIRAGVSFLAATGDTGSPGSYPAFSSNVVAVGGTTLDRSGSTYTETGWAGSGGGISQYVAKPPFQNLITTPSATKRTIPDVSINANPNSGVYVLNTSQAVHDAGGLTNLPPASWFQVGGTSLSAPLWAGIVAVANQGRALLGRSSFATSRALLNRLYALPQIDFNDILAGTSNGLFATDTGYDLVTGRGSPKAPLVLHVAGGDLTGALFIDADGDATFDSGETALSGLNVYLDANNNGDQDTGELTATTTSAGTYAFTDLIGGLGYTVRLAPSTATIYQLTAASASLTTISYGINVNNIGLFPRNFAGTSLTARLDSFGLTLQVFNTSGATGSPAYSIVQSRLGSAAIIFNGTTDADVFTVDLSNGNPIGPGGLSIAGTTVADQINVIGSGLTDLITVENSSLTIAAATLSISTVGTINLSLMNGNDRVDINGVPGGRAIVIDGGAGNETIALGTRDGTTSAIIGNVSASTLSSGDVIIFNDSNSVIATTYTLTGSAAGGNFVRSNSTSALTFGAGVRFDLSPGKADDVIEVTPSQAAALNIFADAALATDNDRLRVLAAVNSGFSFSPGANAEAGAFAFSNGDLPIAFNGVEHNQPLAVTAKFDFAGAAPAITITFTHDVSASLDNADLTIDDLTHGTTIAATFIGYDALTQTANYRPATLPDANLRATLAASGVTNPLSDPLVLDAKFDDFFLAGDVNHDRVVNFDDLVVIAQRYNQTGLTYAEGNLDYSPGGEVNFDDLAILAQQYNASLAPPSTVLPAAVVAKSSASTSKSKSTKSPRMIDTI